MDGTDTLSAGAVMGAEKTACWKQAKRTFGPGWGHQKPVLLFF